MHAPLLFSSPPPPAIMPREEQDLSMLRIVQALQERMGVLEGKLAALLVASQAPADMPPGVVVHETADAGARVRCAFLRAHVQSGGAVERLLEVVRGLHGAPLAVQAYTYSACPARDLFVSEADEMSLGEPRYMYDAETKAGPGAATVTVQMLVRFRHSVVTAHLAAELGASMRDDLDTSTPERHALVLQPITRRVYAKYYEYHILACRRGQHVTRVVNGGLEYFEGPAWSPQHTNADSEPRYAEVVREIDELEAHHGRFAYEDCVQGLSPCPQL